MKINNIFILALGLILIISVVGCDSNRVYEQNIEVSDGVWNKDSAIVFQIDALDTISKHNLLINIRNSGSYRYSNLFLFVNTTFPDGRIMKDTIECTLAKKNGKWVGTGAGGVYDVQQPYKNRALTFHQAGLYTFEIKHGMREEELDGIADIGFRIEKLDE